MNAYVTVRCFNEMDEFFVNIISYNGNVVEWGRHPYIHRRSARRAAIRIAKRKDISYRQDLEYGGGNPASFLTETVSR